MRKTVKAMLIAGCICCTPMSALATAQTVCAYDQLIASVTKVSIAKDVLAIGESAKLVLTWSSGKQTEVTFSSSDESVATVDKDGVVTGIADGKATITVSYLEGKGVKTIDISVSHEAVKSEVYNTSEVSLGDKFRKYDTLHYDGKSKGSCANVVNTKGNYDLVYINIDDYVLPFDAELVGIDGLVIYLAPDIEGITYLDGRKLNAGDLIDRNTHLLCYDYKIKSADKSSRMIFPVFLPEYYGEYIGDGEIKVKSIDHDSKVIELESVEVKADTVDGDVNSDGEFAVSDAVLLQRWLLGVPDTKLNDWRSADLCSDGKLDVFDLCFMKKKLLSGQE